MVHQDLPYYYSTNFRVALECRFKEGAEGKLKPDDAGEHSKFSWNGFTSDNFLLWGVPWIGRRSGKSKPRSSQIDSNRKDAQSSSQDFDAFYSAQPEAELINTHIFADQYDAPDLRE